MAYIGNGRTLLVLGPNVQDDIIPDGVSSTFTLSLEVPGGYEANVIVVRKRYLLDNIVLASTAVSIVAPNQIKVLADQDLAAAFSIIQVPTTATDVSNITISGATNEINNGSRRVTGVTYNGTDVTITVLGANLVGESGAALTVNWGRTTDWEVLAPETDYVIGGSIGPNYNQQITFQGGYIPSLDDSVYVIHKGDATYNFVPSQASVGPDQLTQNLRNFVCDRFTGNGSTTTFALAQEAINSKTLLVSIDGIEKDGDDPEQSFIGAWKLDAGGLSITFLTAPANATKIRILHLSFSTVSRRAVLSPGQAGTVIPGSVDNAALTANAVTTDKIAPGGVTLTDIAADNVNGSKILLNNNESLRSKDSSSAPQGLLKLSATNRTTLNTPGSSLHISFSDANVIDVDATSLSPTANNGRALGTSTKKWSELFVLGTTRLGPTEVDSLVANGNGSFNGNITLATPGATVDGVDLTALQATVVQLQAMVAAALPTGSMQMWMVDSAAPAGFLLCNGSAVSRTTHSALFATIGTTFGTGDGSTTFNVPDLRQRFPLGKAASGTGSLWGNFSGIGGNIDHTHTGGAHTHDMSAHTHQVPAHYHAVVASSDLSISAPSGGHQTIIDISHTHTASATSSTTGVTNTYVGTGISAATNSQTPSISLSDPGHSHGAATGGHATFNTGGQSANHSHTIDHDHGSSTTDSQLGNHSHGFTTGSAGSHSHTASGERGTGAGNTSSGNKAGMPATSTASGQVDVFVSSAGAHTHTGITDNTNLGHGHNFDMPPFTGSSGETSVDHSHNIAANSHTHTINSGTTGISASQGSHSHTVTITDPGHNHGQSDPGHTHSISVTALGVTNKTHGPNASDLHTHAASSFSGRIGLVTGGQDGNSNFNTLGPSAVNTGSSGAVLTTSSNPPFHTVHFIIKT